MELENKNLICEFFKLEQKLYDTKTIRSGKYLGDIAEHISQKIFKLDLCDNQREKGFDAEDNNGNKYQIKINNSSKKTNQIISNKKNYDYLLLLITRNSKLFSTNDNRVFISIYKIDSKTLKDNYIAKKFITSILPEISLDENLNIIK